MPQNLFVLKVLKNIKMLIKHSNKLVNFVRKYYICTFLNTLNTYELFVEVYGPILVLN